MRRPRERARPREAAAPEPAGTPLARQVRLLEEATAALDAPFMLVVAGEFNSGKSSAVNALLGGRFLKARRPPAPAAAGCP